MLSYRHAFHAGNPADLLKHVALVEILGYLREKEKPFVYIDTHAGAGLYRLDTAQAMKHREFDDGIGRLLAAGEPELEPFLEIVRHFNPDGRLRRYPGSPMIAERLLREQDQGWLFELHPSDFPALRQAFQGNRRFRLAQEDGFDGLIRLLPPASRRGCVLIDPAYEVKDDYQRVVKVLIQAHRRFATGIYCLWYPVVDRSRIDLMERNLIKSGLRRIQRFELGRETPPERGGMQTSGLFVVNPPWTLFERMGRLLPLLAAKLGDGEPYRYGCDELVGE